MQKKHSKAEALKLIRKLAKSGVVFSSHVKQRMTERGFQARDVLHVIESGAIYSEPEVHPRTGRWTYKVEGKTLDGERLHIFIDIKETDNCVVILTGTT